MGRTSLKLCILFAPFLALLIEAQGESKPNARSYWYTGVFKREVKEAHQADDGLILSEATSNYALSRGASGLQLDQPRLTKAEGRGGDIYEYFTNDLRNRRANANIVTQVRLVLLKYETFL